MSEKQKPRLELVRSKQLDLRDQRLLEWFFGYGQSVFQRSTFSDMVEQLHDYMYGQGKQCRLCKGVGFTSYGDDKLCGLCNGLGHTPKRHPNSDPDTWTVKPKKLSFSEPSYMPEHDDLARFAQASRAIRRVDEADPLSVSVLAAYWGNLGARWDATDRGRLFAVFSLTDAGDELITRWQERAKRDPSMFLRMADIIGAEASIQIRQPTPERGKLLARAEEEATKMYDKAVDVWESCK
jgi:hypothetical protein